MTSSREAISLHATAPCGGASRMWGITSAWLATILRAAAALGLSCAVVGCNSDGITWPFGRKALKVASVSVSPDTLDTSPFIFATPRPRLAVVLKDSAGHALAGVPVRWTSRDTSVATVTTAGIIVARTFGETHITATSGRDSGTARVSVQPNGDTDLVVVAHRGFAGVFPENTLVAIQGAYDLGADAVEIDVRLSRDGVPMIIHDPTVDRTTNGTGAVSRLTTRQLQALDACSKFSTQWGPCPVPRLSEALQVARGRGRLLLHLQNGFTLGGIRAVLRAVRSAQVEDQVIFISFEVPPLRLIRVLDPGASLGFLFTGVPPVDSVLQLRSAAILLPVDSLLELPGGGRDYVQRVKAAGIDVGAWTLYSPDRGRALLAAGNVRLITDIPLDVHLLR